MTDLAQVALDFGQLCLNWERPVDRKYAEQNRDPHGHPSKVWSPYIFDHYGKNDQFHYADLNAVMKAVQSWCDKTGCNIELRYSPYQGGFGVLCEGVDTWDKNACHALLAACLEAARKLKA